MSRRRKPSAITRQLQAECADLMEPLWRPAPHIRGRHTPADLRVAHQHEARAAAFEWLSRRVGATLTSFDNVTDLRVLAHAKVILEDATIYTVERDPGFASTPYGAAMIAAWRAREEARKAEFGHLVAFRKAQQAKRDYQPPEDPNAEFKSLMRGDVENWRKPL